MPKVLQTLDCLLTVYRLLTAVISDKVYGHCKLNNIFTEEQTGCCFNSLGFKDLATIDSIVVSKAKQHQRNLHMVYVNNKQVFPSVSHNYLMYDRRI